jgi:hypothetical protein
MLTTWNSACGIAEYSRNLIDEFVSNKHNILVLNNTTDGESISFGVSFVETRVFGVHWWNQNPAFEVQIAWDAMNYFERAVGPLDALFVQYQSSLYETAFNKFIDGVKCKKVITRHDSSVNSRHRFDKFDYTIVHSTEVLNPFSTSMGHRYIPFPTLNLEQKVFSFGMGRNDYEFIKQACNGIDVAFEWHDSRECGWLPESELLDMLNDSDAIVLWYNDVPIGGQSSALRTAISSCRPVIVNDIPWFKDAPDFVYKVTPKDVDKEFTASRALQATLWDVLHLGYIRNNSYENCAKKYLEILDGREK